MDEPDEPAELAERRAALYAEIRELIEPLPRELVSYRVMLVLAHPLVWERSTVRVRAAGTQRRAPRTQLLPGP